MILGILERFGGYTYSSLMAEDASFMSLLMLEELGGSRQQMLDEMRQGVA